MRRIPCCSCHRRSSPFLYSRYPLRPPRGLDIITKIFKEYRRVWECIPCCIVATNRVAQWTDFCAIPAKNERGDMKPDSHRDQGFSVGVASSCNLDARALRGFLKKYLEHLHHYIIPWLIHCPTADLIIMINTAKRMICLRWKTILSLTKLANFIFMQSSQSDLCIYCVYFYYCIHRFYRKLNYYIYDYAIDILIYTLNYIK